MDDPVFGTAAGEGLKSVSGINIPAHVLAQLQADYIKEAGQIWNDIATRIQVDGSVKIALSDRRFAANDWAQYPAAALTAQLYLLNARTLLRMAEAIECEEKMRQRIRFAVEQWIAAANPSNFLALNPEAQRKAMETGGNSIAQGIAHLLTDLQRGHVSQTDHGAFEVGRNVATTEGSVVYENELFQLIEYKPLTAKVHARPMLFVSPCINKYYILDLRPDNSMIRWVVEQGHRLFVMSWRNPDHTGAGKTVDDYIEHGPIEAMRVVLDITGSDKLNALGFCIGGMLLTTALAVLARKGASPVSSFTLLTTLLDFSDPGVLALFVDEPSVQLREMTIGERAPGGPGLLTGSELANTFSFLRPDELVWNYVVGNYLKGETPRPFDLLYWNGDSTNLPGPLACWCMRNTYLEDKLKLPDVLTVCGEKIDLRTIDAPVYIYGSQKDHLVPWTSAYRSVALLKGERRFVLGASGHIAGVINPPRENKRSYWLGNALPEDPQQWIEQATEHPGSWWTDWGNWLHRHAGEKIPAPKTQGSGRYKPIEPAPGRYVEQKAWASRKHE
ncbi:class I poly(R)-hydroxyalkanoic acid synthase [Noviherbaspirillum saxi]|uniref:Class I poly(R)-hydroxyalkanoic acid synthase n=1 Tax=Noviherbaspirillum saxi TaxID=2320863 RepID=A0A3A3FPV5_9BURK|nr:class I poly(R)-hydroxyalkanoic acid synthase [Noviherbaspirillum saxi]RJF95729.1 class I poly(R)-hydroxyalkanoic acid synthase [Noviherbaspirillum saxi]